MARAAERVGGCGTAWSGRPPYQDRPLAGWLARCRSQSQSNIPSGSNRIRLLIGIRSTTPRSRRTSGNRDCSFDRVIGTDDPDLSRFKRSGGKLIVWHGWLDSVIFPRRSIDYYGPSRTDNSRVRGRHAHTLRWRRTKAAAALMTPETSYAGIRVDTSAATTTDDERRRSHAPERSG